MEQQQKRPKQSEARILVYLSQAPLPNTFTRVIAGRLDSSYTYTSEMLDRMAYKGWLTKKRHKNRVFYQLTDTAPLEQAKEILANDG